MQQYNVKATLKLKHFEPTSATPQNCDEVSGVAECISKRWSVMHKKLSISSSCEERSRDRWRTLNAGEGGGEGATNETQSSWLELNRRTNTHTHTHTHNSRSSQGFVRPRILEVVE